MEGVWVPELLCRGKSLTVQKGTIYYMADIDILRLVCYSSYPYPNEYTIFIYELDLWVFLLSVKV